MSMFILPVSKWLRLIRRIRKPLPDLSATLPASGETDTAYLQRLIRQDAGRSD